MIESESYQSCGVVQESSGEEAKMIWACREERGGVHRETDDGNGSWQEKGNKEGQRGGGWIVIRS